MKILVVEDSLDVQELLVTLLERKGCTVDTASFCRSAKERLARWTYDCIIVDYQLPDGVGLEVLPADLPKTCKVLLFTGEEVTPQMREDSLLTGVHRIITKPDYRSLLNEITNCADDFNPSIKAIGKFFLDPPSPLEQLSICPNGC